MSCVFNAERNASDVVILSAQAFAGPPLAVIELPVRGPVGLPGGWFLDPPWAGGGGAGRGRAWRAPPACPLAAREVGFPPGGWRAGDATGAGGTGSPTTADFVP